MAAESWRSNCAAALVLLQKRVTAESRRLLKYDLGRDVPLRFEKLTHFYTKFCWNMGPIFMPEPQIPSKFYQQFQIIF